MGSHREDGDAVGGKGRGRRRRRVRLDPNRRVVVRDFLIYEIRLALDGLKGFLIGLLTIPAVLLDLLHPGDRPGHRFYGVMRLGERLDRWLSLYGVADAAEADPEGMFGVSRAGSPTLLGRLEALVHRAVVGHDEDRITDPPAEPAAPGTGEAGDAEAAGAAGAEPTRPPPRAARVAGDLFDQGLEVLDRAVDVLDKPEKTEPPDQPV